MRSGARWGMALVTVAALLVAAAPAAADSVTVHAKKGGFDCKLTSFLKRAGTINYGIRVTNCDAKYGIRYAGGGGYLSTPGEGPVDHLDSDRGNVPFENDGSYTPNPPVSPADPFHTSLGVVVVLRGRGSRTTRKLDKWRDPGPACRVGTTKSAGDTIRCTLTDEI